MKQLWNENKNDENRNQGLTKTMTDNLGQSVFLSGKQISCVVENIHGSFDGSPNFGLVQNGSRQVELECRLPKGQANILIFVKPWK